MPDSWGRPLPGEAPVPLSQQAGGPGKTQAEADALKNKGGAVPKAALPVPGQSVPGAPSTPAAPATAVAYGTPWGTTPPPPGTGTPATPAVPSNAPYWGMSADSARTIERVGAPAPLDPGAFGISGFDQMQGGYGNLQQRLLQMQQGVGGMQQNAAQSRAMALGALTNPGPSMAEAQLRSGADAATSNALAMARSGRGFGSAGQMQQAAMQGADAQGQVNQQAAQLRAGEEAQRRQQMLGLAGQDLGALGQQQQYTLGASGQGLQGMQQQGQLGFMQQQALADKAKTDAQMQQQAQQTNAQFANYKDPPSNMGGQIAGSAIGAFASILPLLAGGALGSDRASKTKIQRLEAENAALGGSGRPDASWVARSSGQMRQAPGTAERGPGMASGQAVSRASALGGAPKGGAASAFAALPGYSYEYKNPALPGAAPGTHIGPMADEIQQVLPGAVLSGAGPNGTDMVDPGRLALANASATGEIARKLKALGVEI